MEITKIKHNFLASLFLQPSADPFLHSSLWQTLEAFSTQGDPRLLSLHSFNFAQSGLSLPAVPTDHWEHHH